MTPLDSSPPLSTRDTFQDPQCVSETEDSTESYVRCFFLYIPMVKFNSFIKHSERLTIIVK